MGFFYLGPLFKKNNEGHYFYNQTNYKKWHLKHFEYPHCL
jgi:hypothetical protein